MQLSVISWIVLLRILSTRSAKLHEATRTMLILDARSSQLKVASPSGQAGYCKNQIGVRPAILRFSTIWLLVLLDNRGDQASDLGIFPPPFFSGIMPATRRPAVQPHPFRKYP